MNVEGWYYLHQNGDVILRRNAGRHTLLDMQESPLVRAVWEADRTRRECAWTILIEGLASGARPDRIRELALKWRCDDADGQEYAKRIGVHVVRDGSQWFAHTADFVNLQESTCYGFGATVLEALAELAKALGYKPSPMGSISFTTLAKRRAIAPAPTPVEPPADANDALPATLPEQPIGFTRHLVSHLNFGRKGHIATYQLRDPQGRQLPIGYQTRSGNEAYAFFFLSDVEDKEFTTWEALLDYWPEYIKSKVPA